VVKNLIMIALLALLATPSLVRANDRDDRWDRDGHDPWDHNNKKDHDDIRADQLAGIGIGGAGLIGVAGYLILRKRNASV
jgi:hypothetical protein